MIKWIALAAVMLALAGCSNGPRRCVDVAVTGQLSGGAWIDAWTPICTGKRRRR
jgi:hypothetical protein